ncbi:unnamed protein product [Caenorhabditis angaria]|uniref:ANK_REP_REGION domain-containing protein n=1 Tax=Caenorhabditis angaria TaxID=860376 RepID=A0A9P1N1Q7_9PELO|nr:unnamed protein product [Caenorhabditis angaria]
MEDLNDWEAQGAQEEPAEDGMNLGFTKELIDEIRSKKESNPGMFVSAWQEDEEGIDAKNLENPIEKWLTAAEDGDLEEVRRIYQEDREILNSQDADGYTALHRASYNNNLQVVEYLLSVGADVEARTKDQWTPLLSAANWGNYEVIGKLLSHGVDVNATSNGHLTALHLAVQSQNENPENVFHSVRYLLQAPGIDAGVVNGSGDTPLKMAYRSNEQIYYLIKEFLEKP